MNLNLPVVGGEFGPQYASDNNAAFFQVDSHNHTSGQGVQIPPAGININGDLPFNGNNATSMNAVEFNNNISPLPGASPFLNSIYFAAGDFYVNDEVGNQIQITKNGAVNATSSGISSGTASASFSGGVLIVDSNVNTPANIQAGSILIGNNVANSKFVTLQAPGALSSNYSLTLPQIPGANSFVFLDSSGNFGTTLTSALADSVGATMTSTGADDIGVSMTSVGADAIAASRTRAVGSTVGIGGIAESASSGSSSNATTVLQTVPGLSVTITTSGRPVVLKLENDQSTFNGNVTVSGGNNTITSQGVLQFVRNGTNFCGQYIGAASAPPSSGSTNVQIPSSSFSATDFVAAGTYTYTVQIACLAVGLTMFVTDTILVAYEL